MRVCTLPVRSCFFLSSLLRVSCSSHRSESSTCGEYFFSFIFLPYLSALVHHPFPFPSTNIRPHTPTPFCINQPSSYFVSPGALYRYIRRANLYLPLPPPPSPPSPPPPPPPVGSNRVPAYPVNPVHPTHQFINPSFIPPSLSIHLSITRAVQWLLDPSQTSGTSSSLTPSLTTTPTTSCAVPIFLPIPSNPSPAKPLMLLSTMSPTLSLTFVPSSNWLIGWAVILTGRP